MNEIQWRVPFYFKTCRMREEGLVCVFEQGLPGSNPLQFTGVPIQGSPNFYLQENGVPLLPQSPHTHTHTHTKPYGHVPNTSTRYNIMPLIPLRMLFIKQMLVVLTKQSDCLMLNCLWNYQLSLFCLTVPFSRHLTPDLQISVSCLQIKFLIRKCKWNHHPNGKQTGNKASYLHLGPISPFSTSGPRTIFHSKLYRNRATEFCTQ